MQVAEGLEWRHIYWVRGTMPRGVRFRNAVTDPPCSGWQHAFVLTGEKRSTIFCPYSFDAHTVPNDCLEVAQSAESKEYRPDWLHDLMKRKWDQFQTLGWQKDYDTCALILRRLGLPVPAQIMTGGGEDDRKKGGKEVGSALLKPVKRDGKRGRFLAWFLEGGGSRSVREAMAEFSMTRSNALSYLYMLQKDHGIGYTLVGDVAAVTLPDGCTDPFNEEQPAATLATDMEDDDDDDDSWLD